MFGCREERDGRRSAVLGASGRPSAFGVAVVVPTLHGARVTAVAAQRVAVARSGDPLQHPWQECRVGLRGERPLGR